jgi:hypothetical protein
MGLFLLVAPKRLGLLAKSGRAVVAVRARVDAIAFASDSSMRRFSSAGSSLLAPRSSPAAPSADERRARSAARRERAFSGARTSIGMPPATEVGR